MKCETTKIFQTPCSGEEIVAADKIWSAQDSGQESKKLENTFAKNNLKGDGWELHLKDNA